MDRPKRQRKVKVVLELSEIHNKSTKTSKPKNAKKAVKSASQTKRPLKDKQILLDESENDDIYNYLIELQKQKKKDARDKLKAVKSLTKNIKSSTPVQNRKGRKNAVKENLFPKISPVRRSAVDTEIDNERSNKQNIVEEPDAPHIQEIKNMIAEFKLQSELSAININAENAEKSSGFDSLIREIENRKNHSYHSILESPPIKVIRTEKKTVFFDIPESSEKSKISSPIILKPGKWRRSLAAWRKSHNPSATNSHRFTKLFPIKTDPNNVVCHPEKIEESAEKSAVLLEQSDEGLQIPGELSLLDSSVECVSLLQEPTSFAVPRKTFKRETSVFSRTSIFYGLESPLIEEAYVQPVLSARELVLRRCGQQEPLPFNEIYSESILTNCQKIGEGAYSEVFCDKTNDEPIVLKIIPIEGDENYNGEPQKRYNDILSEIVLSMELSELRNGTKNVTDGFGKLKRVTCVKGAYPQHLIDLWEDYDYKKESENDNPCNFYEDQLYIVFEQYHGGTDLEAFKFKNAEEAFSVFLQVALTLSVAENKFEFEHRDLHWGNILIARTSQKFVEYRVDGQVITLPTHGVKASIIDFTLSRMVYDGAVLFTNLANDPDLFEATGDYQFDIYRLMRDRVDNEFKRYEPFTNILWLHYLVDKLIDGANYMNSKSDKHKSKSAVSKMMQLRDELLEYQSASSYVKSLQN